MSCDGDVYFCRDASGCSVETNSRPPPTNEMRGADSEIRNEEETGAKDRLRIQSATFRLVSSSADDSQGTGRNVNVPVLSDCTRFLVIFQKFRSKTRPTISEEHTR